MTNPYATDEPSEFLWFEQSINAAVHIGSMAYGIHIAVYFACLYWILRARRPRWELSLAYASVLFALGTINICMNINFNENAWINNRNYPGGPLAYMLEQQSRFTNTIGNSASILAAILVDGLLIWRCYVIWSKQYWVIIVPTLMYIASIILSVMTTIRAALPNASLWKDNTLDVSVPYFALLMSLNTLVSGLMVGRLLWHRSTVRSALGPEHGQLYTSVAATIIESAVPYGLISFIFVILYGIKNTGANLFLPLLAQLECITSELILLRVSRGRAWTSRTSSKTKSLDTMKFGSFGKPTRSSTAFSASRPHGSSTAGKTTAFASYDDDHIELSGKGVEV